MRLFGIKQVVLVLVLVIVVFLLNRIVFGGFLLKTWVNPIVWLLAGYVGFRFYRDYVGKTSYILKSFLSIAFAIYLLVSLFWFSNLFLCRQSKMDTLYTNVSNSSLSIICLRYECYGTNSDCDIYCVKDIGMGVKWITKIRREDVDPVIWQKAPSTN